MIRGHLRTCERCNQRFEEELALIDAAAELLPIDPPDHIWEGISDRIAVAEIRDSRAGGLRRWFRATATWRTPAVLGFGAAIAVIAILYFRTSSASQVATHADGPPVQQAGDADTTASHQALRLLSADESDQHYLTTIADLREILEEDREAWSEEQAAAVDAHLAAFSRGAIDPHLASSRATAQVQSRDHAFAQYQQEIAFLQSALAGDLPNPSSVLSP